MNIIRMKKIENEAQVRKQSARSSSFKMKNNSAFLGENCSNKLEKT